MIEYVKRLAGPFTSEGQSRLPFGFLIFEKTDVYVATADDPEAQAKMLVYGQDYSVEMNADQTATPGGTVVLTTPIVKGNIFVVGSAVAYTQNMQLTNFSRFPPEIINESLDRIVVQIQQLVEQLGRTVSLPPTSAISADELLSNIFRVHGLSTQVLAFKDAIISVAGVKEHVEALGVNVDAILKVSDNLQMLLNVYDLLPYVANAKSYAERAEVASQAAKQSAAKLDAVEEHYPAFLRALEEVNKLFSSLDEVQLSVLNTASVTHKSLTRNELQKYARWQDWGLEQLRAVSTASVSATTGSSHAVDAYLSWELEGVSEIRKLGEASLLTRRQNESAIWAYDDEVRMKKLLLRSYVEKPYLLFIVAGQSNAVGTGPSPGYEDASYCGLYWDWKDQNSKSLKPLKDPVYRSFRGSAWPSFARKIFELTGRKVIILNVAWGGAAVTNINPNNSWYQDATVTSLRRTDATREWTDMAAELKAKDIQYELAGMMWIQGEAECARVGAGTITVQDYIDGTLDVFKYFRELTNTAELPIYLAQIGYYKHAMANPELLGGYEQVRKAQLDLCKEHETDSIFMASELPGTYFKAGYMQDAIHYNQRGYNSLGASFARFISNHQSF